MTVDALRLVPFGTHRCTMPPMSRVNDWRLFLVLAVSLIAAASSARPGPLGGMAVGRQTLP